MEPLGDLILTLAPDRPLQRQIYDGIRQRILNGMLAPGARLPSSRELAGELGIGRNTVTLAYEALKAEGYLTARPGEGTRVSRSLPEEALFAKGDARESGKAADGTRLSQQGRRLLEQSFQEPAVVVPGGRIDFRHGRPPLLDFPFETWRRLLAAQWRSGGEPMLSYSPPEGMPELRQAILAHVRQSRAIRADVEQVLVVNGAQQALDLCSRVLLDPGDAVAIEDPHYLAARRVFRSFGARLAPVPVDAQGLQTELLPAEARCIYVTPSHQFPTGAVLPLERRLELLAWARRLGAWIIEDDYNGEFRFDARPVESLQGLDDAGRVLYAGSFSKTMFPSLRIGYLVVPMALVDVFRRAKSLADRFTPLPEQAALATFLASGDYQRYLRRARTANARRRETLLAAAERHWRGLCRIEGSDAGLHVVARFPRLGPDREQELILAAGRAGVGVYPFSRHYLGPSPGAGLILGYCALPESQIRLGVRLLGEAWTGVLPD